MYSRAVRRLAIGVAVVAAVVAWWLWIAHGWIPYVDYDTQIFEQVARQPLGVDLLFQAKPLIVPLIYRAADNNHQAIAIIQGALSLVAWTALGVALVSALRRRWVRIAAIVVAVAFVLAPVRMGFTASLMTESIDDSLMALLAAAAICVLQRRRFAVPAAVLVGAIWLFTRDTNAAVAIVAAGVAMLLWRRWALAGVLVAAAFASWTATRPHALLAYQDNWYARFSPRTAYPLVDNLALRVFPDDDLPADFATFGVRDGSQELNVERIVRAGPEHRATQDWIVDHGLATYAGWWLHHPFARLGELIDWRIVDGPLNRYMPQGWSRSTWLPRRLTTSHLVLLVLIVASPFLLRRPRKHPLRGLALCMLASGLAGLVVAYYGDAAEVTRHCYGSGQQIALALFVALLAWLDVVEKPRSMR